MAKLEAVTVIEKLNGDVQSMRAFTNDQEGNKEAEKTFIRLMIEYENPEADNVEVADSDIWNSKYSCHLEDGIYSDDNGYEIVIYHTTD